MCGILQGPGVENSDTEAEYMIAAHPILTILKTHPCTRGSDPYMTVSGGAGLSGALDDGVGKWRLAVESHRPLVVMSLLSSPTGHLRNLSTAPDRGGGQ